MEQNKRGIFFTFISLIIMGVLILVFTPQADISLQKDANAVRARISSVDIYVDDLENRYLEAVLRASAHKTILSLIFYINSTGDYITNFDATFLEVISNGTIGNVPVDNIVGKKIMENNTLTNWSNKITSAAKDMLNANTTVIVKNVSAFQTNPWSIDLMMSVNLTVSSDVAVWEKNEVIRATIGIEGFHDPYYSANTGRQYANQIKKSSVELNQWNITRVREHLRNSTYVHWQNSDAPSFLMRFTNTIQPSSCCGIESLVNPNKITPKDQIESYVDYLFWSNAYRARCTELFNITNPLTGGGVWDEFSFFKLDFEHLARYNITSQDAVGSC